MTYRCTGRGPATQTDCSFWTDDVDAAFAHFEQTDHDVEEDPAHV